MKTLIVTDFDGCLLVSGIDIIPPNVADVLKEIQALYAVAIVSARASQKAVDEARNALCQANLGSFHFLHRDMRFYNNTSKGIITFKRQAISLYTASTGLKPLLGIGDQPTDEVVYHSLNMVVVRLMWSPRAHDESCADIIFEVDETSLGWAWRRIFDGLIQMKEEQT